MEIRTSGNVAASLRQQLCGVGGGEAQRLGLAAVGGDGGECGTSGSDAALAAELRGHDTRGGRRGCIGHAGGKPIVETTGVDTTPTSDMCFTCGVASRP